VLEKLNIQLKTPTPLGSQSTDSAPKTPHNLKQLQKQESAIKKLLRQCTQSPLGPMNDAINRLVKGCEIYMNSVILLSKEVQDLRAAHKKNQGKKKRSRQQMAHEEGLTIQEGQDLI